MARQILWRNVRGWKRTKARDVKATSDAIIPQTWESCEAGLLQAADRCVTAGLKTQARSIRGCVVFLRGMHFLLIDKVGHAGAQCHFDDAGLLVCPTDTPLNTEEP